jgi:DNA-binding NarL/FixJ family response regulator
MKILIADDHEIFLDSLALLLSTFDEVEVVGMCTNGQEALDFIEKYDVDLLITDFDMPKMSGIEVAHYLKINRPEIKVFMLSVSEEAEMIRKAFLAGVVGYMMKRSGRSELLSAIEAIGKGQRYFSESVLNKLMQLELLKETPKDEIPAEIKALTEREVEIIRLISNGLSSNDIAEKLFISDRTVDKHRFNLMKKLNVKNATSLIKFAMKNGLLD